MRARSGRSQYIALVPAQDALPPCLESNIGTIIMKPFAGSIFSVARTALKFTLGDRYSDVIIPGVMSLAEVDENVAVATGSYEITPAEWKMIGQDKKDLGENDCRGCDYCQACPQGIPISTVLREEKGLLKRMGWWQRLDKQFGDAIPKVESCLHCGKCASCYPYHLDIPELLPVTVTSMLRRTERGDY